jgi:hypothetical protein
LELGSQEPGLQIRPPREQPYQSLSKCALLARGQEFPADNLRNQGRGKDVPLAIEGEKARTFQRGEQVLNSRLRHTRQILNELGINWQPHHAGGGEDSLRLLVKSRHPGDDSHASQHRHAYRQWRIQGRFGYRPTESILPECAALLERAQKCDGEEHVARGLEPDSPRQAV